MCIELLVCKLSTRHGSGNLYFQNFWKVQIISRDSCWTVKVVQQSDYDALTYVLTPRLPVQRLWKGWRSPYPETLVKKLVQALDLSFVRHPIEGCCSDIHLKQARLFSFMIACPAGNTECYTSIELLVSPAA